MKELIIPLILLILLIIVLYYVRYYEDENNKESFTNNKDNDQYLYPIKGLTNICAKENLFPSYTPKACYVDDVLNQYANCKCEDEKGNCKICYPTIKKDSKNASIVYNADSAS
jgi:hypothetical protein